MLRLLCIAFCFSLGSLAAWAQQTAPSSSANARPTVGLVLSGGSAKGIAHIGTIRVLEDAGIPVDVVAGTSMGAIVGSLYAMGYTTEQMAEIMRHGDWAGFFTDAIDRRDQGILGRIGEGAALVSLPIRGGAVTLPSGLVAGQDVMAQLSELTWPARMVRDFRELPRPFAAVAVDTETGEAVRFTSGSLALAVRASMSIPTLFEPVEIDGQRYVDGGFVRNLPAEDALALGADVLVCVDVSFANEPKDADAPTLVDVLVDVAFFASERERPDQRALCDIIIDPDVDALSLFDFDAVDTWIERGAEAAEAQRDALDALAERLASAAASPLRPAVPQRAAPELAAPEAQPVAQVRVEGVGGTAQRVLGEVLTARIEENGGVIGPGELGRVIERLHASGAFQLITYRFERVAGTPDAVALLVDAEPTEAGRLGFGFRYDTEYNAALLFELEQRNRLIFGSEAQFDLRLGEFVFVGGRYVAGLGVRQPWTFALTGGYLRAPLQVFLGRDRAQASGFFRLASLEAYAGPVLFDAFVTGAGVRLAWSESAPEVAADSILAAGTTYASFAALAVFDSQDRPDFPRSGANLFLAAEVSPGLLGSNFQRIMADADFAVPLNPSVSLGGSGYASRVWGLTDPAESPPNQFVHMGGPTVPDLFFRPFVRLYGAGPQEFIGPAALVGRAHLHLENARGWFARGEIDAGYAGLALTLDRDAYRTGYGVTLGTNTIGGPVALTLYDALGDRTPQLLFRFGRTF